MSREAFDPSDPFNAAADDIRRRVAEFATTLRREPAFAALPAGQQLEAWVAGVTTAMVGVGFAYVGKPKRHLLMAEIEAYLPLAAQQAEGIIADGTGGTA